MDHLRSCLFKTSFLSLRGKGSSAWWNRLDRPIQPPLSIHNPQGSQAVCLLLVATRENALMSGVSSSTDGLGRCAVQAHLCKPPTHLHR